MSIEQKRDSVIEGLLELAASMRAVEVSDEPPSEFDKGYEQARQECADELKAAIARALEQPARRKDMSEFVPVVTDEMVVAGHDAFANESINGDPFERQIAATIAHEDFQRQLRAYVAEQMRGLVPEIADPEKQVNLAGQYQAQGRNALRSIILTRIAKWESNNG